MRANLRSIESNDTLDWEEFAKKSSPDPWRDFGWFTVGVGTEGGEGADLFQVLVSTHAAKHLAIDKTGSFHGITIDCFDAEQIQSTLKERIEAVEGVTWQDIVDRLRSFMHWEYEGMKPVNSRDP